MGKNLLVLHTYFSSFLFDELLFIFFSLLDGEDEGEIAKIWEEK
jgi:hypothetical protein